jgi:dimethylargininase
VIALTQLPSPRLAECQLTYVPRGAIDVRRAVAQHVAFRRALTDAGAQVVALDGSFDLPDGVFIEDTAVVLDEVAVVCRPGTPSRRNETASVEIELRRHRSVVRIEPPATLEGGDVLCVGRELLVGLSSRTNTSGVQQLTRIARRHGYQVTAVPVTGCLHLKTACTALPDGRLLVNPAWIDVAPLSEYEQISVPVSEPWGANIACLDDRVLACAAHARTGEMIGRLGFEVRNVELDEFAKAEGGVTCLCLLINS